MKIALVYGMKMFEGTSIRPMLDIARIADEVGLDYLCLAEHVVQHAAPSLEAHSYGTPMHTAQEPFPEPLTTLSAFSSITRRIGLMTGILIAPLRPAPLLAKQAATIHDLSGGRLTIGVSTSWQREEYASLNMGFDDRGQRLTDIIGACRELWKGGPSTFHSPSVNFENMWCSPNPGDAHAIKVWFGGKFTPRLVKRVATIGDGWIPFQGYRETPADLAPKIEQLRQAMRAEGRDPAGLDVAYWMRTNRPIPEVLEEIPAMAAAGITTGEMVLSSYMKDPSDAGRVLAEVARGLEQYKDVQTAVSA